MRTLTLTALAAVVIIAFVGTAVAAEKTLTGNVACAKCTLKKADAKECQNVLVVQGREGPDRRVLRRQERRVREVRPRVHRDEAGGGDRHRGGEGRQDLDHAHQDGREEVAAVAQAFTPSDVEG